MSEEAQEKQYQPSLKRLEELKKKGTFLRSRDLNGGAIIMIAIIIILVMLTSFYQVISSSFVLSFTQFDTLEHLSEAPDFLYKRLALKNFYMLLPLIIALFCVPFVFAFAFGGFGLSWQLVKFKMERINPFKNLGRIFSFSNLIEIVKSVAKFLLFISLLLFFIQANRDELPALTGFRDEQLVSRGFDLIRGYLLLIVTGTGLIVAIDMLYSFFSFQKKIKMSHQEMKDEHKETDGSPETKRRIREVQLAISRQRIQRDVPGATVIITNPTHYAVALKYDDRQDKAPRIVAMGVDTVAAEIRLIAIKHAIPIYEAPQLARAIYYTGKPGAYIHQDLYMAVAIVLSYIVQLKDYQMGLGAKPAWVTDLKIPKELHFDL
ncbi:EscU/YscU/HrcU family type III secretion system export apparatus switch protein [Legionella sp. CNM-4043-24]|uniref:EscU/YscU/HrcU family type III secretion system export apparatus switch protein n=1 Tax=Legionella sp. CNM-4043-24 TaxID=3421646 RepID=UPI00403AF519